jgi:hypothetical protein
MTISVVDATKASTGIVRRKKKKLTFDDGDGAFFKAARAEMRRKADALKATQIIETNV